jgi:hypothetical protein
MIRKPLAVLVSFVFASSLAAGPGTSPVAKLSATDIAAKNVAARGGLQAWRAVQTMAMSGKMGAGGNQRAAQPIPVPGKKGRLAMPKRPSEEVQLPFVMELARPRKMRLELQFNGQTAIQVFDGANGWKVRPFLNRREVEPYTAEEMKMASAQSDLDGPLVDYAAKGTKIDLDGIEKVGDRDSYKLKLTLKGGQETHVWVDAETFLETKIEGQPRRLDGTYHPVEVYYRDYRSVSGLRIPFVLETKVLPVAKTATGFKDPPVPVEKLIIEKVTVNPKLDDSQFSKPKIDATPAPKGKQPEPSKP